jgi:hypothetical protein
MNIIYVLCTLIIILSYTTFNLLRKNEKLEDESTRQANILAGYMTYLNKMSEIIEHSDKKLKEVDIKGSFESDDEIGFFFQTVKSIQEVLNRFNIKNI